MNSAVPIIISLVIAGFKELIEEFIALNKKRLGEGLCC